MRGIAAVVLAALLAPSAFAQQSPDAAKNARRQADFKARLGAKLKEPWLADGGWMTDYDRARAKAAAEGKLVVAYFSPSYASSPPCEQFEGAVLATEGFRAFAKGIVLFAHFTSRVEGEKYGDLWKEKGGKEFPWVVALDPEGNVLGELGERNLDGLAAMVRDGADYRVLRAKKDLAPAERLRLLELQLDRALLKPEEFRAQAAAIEGLDAATAKRRDTDIVHIDIDRETEPFYRGEPDAALKARVGKVFAEMYRAGRVPTESGRIGTFYSLIQDYAESVKDADLFAATIPPLKEAWGTGKRLEPFYKQMEDRLAALRKGKADGK